MMSFWPAQGGLAARAYVLLALLVVLVATLAFFPTSAAAQEKEYEEWRQKQRQERKEFLSKQDEAFLKFLEQEWTHVKIDAAVSSPTQNKPRQVPRADGPEPDVSAEGDLEGESNLEGEPSKGDSGEGEPTIPSAEESSSEESSTDDSSGEDPSGENPASDGDPTSGEDTVPSESPAPGEDSAPSQRAGEPVSGEASPGGEASLGREVPSEREASLSRKALSRQASLSFFGASSSVPYGTALAPELEAAPSETSIRRFWKKMAEAPYGPMLGAIQEERKELGLSDWGYYLYLDRLSGQLYGGSSPSEQALWTWFALMKSGYAARVGYRQGEAFLVLPVEEKIFGRPQMYIGGQRYYLMVGDEGMVGSGGGSLRTYEGQHGSARRALRLSEENLPDVGTGSETRTVEFSFQGQRRSLEVSYSPATAEYLRAYPDVELGVLMEAGVSLVAEASLKEALRPLLEGLGPRASANLLLKFSQFATDYKRDQEHFGEERYLFPEESLASDYSDCEDRAVLLAYLARELLGREVVGLQWPTHVALAIRTGDGLSAEGGDQTVTDGAGTYIYADPTYLGSSLGMKMPLVEGQEPEIIAVEQ